MVDERVVGAATVVELEVTGWLLLVLVTLAVLLDEVVHLVVLFFKVCPPYISMCFSNLLAIRRLTEVVLHGTVTVLVGTMQEQSVFNASFFWHFADESMHSCGFPWHLKDLQAAAELVVVAVHFVVVELLVEVDVVVVVVGESAVTPLLILCDLAVTVAMA